MTRAALPPILPILSSLPLLPLLLALSAAAGARAPRDTVAEVATAIEDYYFDAARGAEIAAGLRREAAAGRYDAHAAPVDLATVLTDRLEPLDRHFRVRWAPPAPGAARPAPGPGGPPPGPPPVQSHGIRAVQVLPGNVGYLDLAQFSHFDSEADGAGPAAKLAIDAALVLLQETDALLIDLRDNGGGSPAMVGYLASAFTAPGSDIFNTFVIRERRLSEAPEAWHPAPRLDVPLYVLTSGLTGSAAESFTYTLANAGRATVVGERSAGAANPGRAFDIGEGFSVFVSTGSPVSPVTGRNWEADGVTPAIEVPARDALPVAQRHALEAVIAARGDAAPARQRWVLEALQAPRDVAGDLAAHAGTYGHIRVAVEDGALVMYDRRRPGRTLLPLGDGVFYDAAAPQRRVAFAPDALELRFPEGGRSRHPRGPASAP